MNPGNGKTVERAYPDVVAAAEKALQEEGFGILTRIDVRESLKEKLGVDFPNYVILGACAPPLAHRALTCVPEVGVLLPCNVVIRELPDGRTRVEVINAAIMAEMFDEDELRAVADEVGSRLDRVLAAV